MDAPPPVYARGRGAGACAGSFEGGEGEQGVEGLGWCG